MCGLAAAALVVGAPAKNAVRAAGEPTGEPDWDALLEKAEAQGERSCANNDYGINDSYWERNSGYNTEHGQVFDQAEGEYNDLQAFLNVCTDAGLVAWALVGAIVLLFWYIVFSGFAQPIQFIYSAF